MKARPIFNGGGCDYFTDGKLYDVRTPYISNRVGDVTDDRGNSRVIPLDGGPCAHITLGYATSGWLRPHTLPGHWEVIS
jgi:hypothetical protein